MSATFTVPATDDYASASDGGHYRYFAGDVIPLDRAVDLGMPGAEAPADTNPFSGEAADWIAAREEAITAAYEAADAAIAAAIGGDDFPFLMIPRDYRTLVAAAAFGTNLSMFWRFRVARARTVATISTYNGGTAAGNLCVALYTADAGITTLTRVATSGAIAASGTNTWQDLALDVSVALAPGVDYWVGFATSDGTHTVLRVSGLSGVGTKNAMLLAKTSTFPLPASLTVAAAAAGANFAALILA